MIDRLFPSNEATLDRVLRVALGLTMLATVFVGPQTWLGLAGLVPLVTGIVGSCPIYTMLNVGTCPVPRKEA